MKIDLSQVEGYAEMSAEDKVKFFEGFEYEDNADKLTKYKNSIDKLTHENAELNKFKREHLNDEEKKAESDKALQDELEGYRKKEAMRELIDSYLDSYEGMSKETAKKIAETESPIERNKLIAEYMKEYAKKEVEKVQNGTRKPYGGHGSGDDDGGYKPSKNRASNTVDMEKLSKFYKH